jgi:hypothetical protein
MEIIKAMKEFLAAFGLQTVTGDQLVGLFKTDSFCSMVSRAEDIDTIIKAMKEFLAAFGLQRITPDQLVSLFKNKTFCSMMKGKMTLSTVVKNLSRILGTLFVPSQPMTALEFMSFIKKSDVLVVVQECDIGLMVTYLIQTLVQFQITSLDTRRRLFVYNNGPFLSLMKEMYKSETRTLDGTIKTFMESCGITDGVIHEMVQILKHNPGMLTMCRPKNAVGRKTTDKFVAMIKTMIGFNTLNSPTTNRQFWLNVLMDQETQTIAQRSTFTVEALGNISTPFHQETVTHFQLHVLSYGRLTARFT